MNPAGCVFAAIVMGMFMFSSLSMSGVATNQDEPIRCSGVLADREDEDPPHGIRYDCETGDGLWITNDPVVLRVDGVHNGIRIKLTYAGGTPDELCLPGELGCVPDIELNEFRFEIFYRVGDQEARIFSERYSGVGIVERPFHEGAGTYKVTLTGLEGDTAYDLILTPE